jgi:hypothetical protein
LSLYLLMIISSRRSTKNLFSPWYSWKITELALRNDHSITHSLKTDTTGVPKTWEWEQSLISPESGSFVLVERQFYLWTVILMSLYYTNTSIQDILYILHIYFVNKTLHWPVAETLIKHNCQLRLRWPFKLNGNAQELI